MEENQPQTSEEVVETSQSSPAAIAAGRKLLPLLIAGPLLMLVFLIGVIVWGFKTKPPVESNNTAVEIYTKGKSGVAVEERSDSYLVKYKADNFEESFSIDKSAKDTASLSNHLLELAKSNNRSEYSPFYSSSNQDNSNSYKRIVDITLDVSGSVKALASQDPGYYDKVKDKLKNILVQENLKPGDRVRVRFLGANSKVDQVYSIDFTGPKFTYTLDYQRASDTGIIGITGYSLEQPDAQDPQVNATAASVKQLFDKISAKHQEVVQGPPGSGTYLIGHLNKIINDNDVYAGNRFGSVLYIFLTDGEFNLEPSIANRVGVGYCSIETYTTCHPKLLQAFDQGEFLLGDRTGSSTKSLAVSPATDKVFMVGLNKNGDPVYGQSLESFFRGVFKPINTIKFLD